MSEIITHETFKEYSNQLDKNYRENINIAKKLVNEFKKDMDFGDLKDLAMLKMLKENLEIAENAYGNYVKNPISGYHNFD